MAETTTITIKVEGADAVQRAQWILREVMYCGELQTFERNTDGTETTIVLTGRRDDDEPEPVRHL